MSVPAAARPFARLVSRRRPPAPARRLNIEPLEDRAVPANSISIVGHATADANISVSGVINGTITIATTAGATTSDGARLSLTTIENALNTSGVTNVVVTTAVAQGGTDDDEFGDIDWDATNPLTLNGDQLNFSKFGTGKTLTLQTVTGASALGNINLTAVVFDTTDSPNPINLVFDASAPDGSVSFATDGLGSGTVIYTADAVNDLTVKAGDNFGAFVFHDDGSTAGPGGADAAGAVSISAGAVDISHQGGLTAGSTMSVSAADILLDIGTSLDAVGDLTLTGTSSVSADTGGLKSDGGALSVSAPVVTLTQMTIEASGDITVSGPTSVELTNPDPATPVTTNLGDILITGGAVDLPATDLWTNEGKVTVTGTDVTGDFSTFAPHGTLTVTGTNSVNLTDATADDVDGVTIMGGTVTLNGVIVILLDHGDVALTGTDVTLNDTELATNEGGVTLEGTSLVLAAAVIAGTGDVTVTGPVTLGPGTTAVGTVAPGTVTFTGPVDAETAGEPDLEVAGGTITFRQSVGATAGLNSLDIRHGNTRVLGNILNAATITLFDPVPGPFPDPNQTVSATLGINGTVTGNITANATSNPADGRGNLAPGGLTSVGTMTVRGDVILNGDFELDLAVTAGGPTDKLIAIDNPNTPGTTEGNITLGPNSRLGQLGIGQVPGAPVVVIDARTDVAGQFANAPPGVGLMIGTDYARIQTYTPDVVIDAMPAQGKVVKGADEDGTLYTITLTGPGTLVHGKDNFGQRFLVVRDATPASKLAITTKANGSDDVVTFGAGILVNNSLASLTAPKVNIGNQLRSSGPIGAVTFRDFTDLTADQTGPGIFLGGTALNKTSITARNIGDDVIVGAALTSLKVGQALSAGQFAAPVSVTAPAIGTVTARSATADITTPGKLTSVVVGGDFTGTVKAASIGKLQAAGGDVTLTATGAPGVIGSVGTVASPGPDGLTLDINAAAVNSVNVAGSLVSSDTGWNVTGGINSLTAGLLSANITAGYLGTVLVKGNLTTGLSGDIQSSILTVTGNSGATTGSYGIKSLTAKGTVSVSTFDVKAGNVGTFTVGRFLDSQLDLNYTPHDPSTQTFDTGGAFGSGAFKLTAFKTTAIPLGDLNNPRNWAFADSEVAAELIGTVTLSGLKTDNGGTRFGVKVQTPGAVIKITAADDASLNGRTITTPSDLAVSGDFFFLDR